MNRFILLPALLVLFLLLPASRNDNIIGSPPAHADPSGSFILNEISPWPSNGNPWVEILNPSTEAVSIAGWTIEFFSGFAFTFPNNAPVIQPSGLHLLNITGNPLNENGDGCILKSPDGSPIDIITWGFPEIIERPSIPPGAPLMPFTGIRYDDALFQPDDIIFRIPDTWFAGNNSYIGSQNWAYRSSEDATKGIQNHYPGPSVFSPSNGSLIASAIHLAVLDMDFTRQITFQVASDTEFTNIVHTETVADNGINIESLPAGTYYWRVCTAGTDDWSNYRSFTYLGFNLDEILSQTSTSVNHSEVRRYLASAKSGGDISDFMLFGNTEIVSHHIIGIHREVQRKDTRMVCLDGCQMRGGDAWDAPQNGGRPHGNQYCVRTRISMVASSYGCTLSQDRITYYIFQEAGSENESGTEVGHLDDPYKDLGHDIGTYRTAFLYTLEWIYDQPHGTANIVPAAIRFWDDSDTSDMDTIKEFLDGGRPVYRVIPHHATVIDGYAIVRDNDTGDETIMVHVINPGSTDDVSWLSLLDEEAIAFITPPPNGIPMRCDEAGVSMDSDGDGLVDFDESERFGTDPHNRDSDDDGLDDKTDMLGYLFEQDGSYNNNEMGRDYDSDTVAKEMDPDNDHAENNGVEDGCEDTNLNGFFDEGGDETDNFMMADDFDIIGRNCYSGYIRFESEASVPAFPNGVMKLEEIITIENGQPTSSRQYIYDHWWQLTAENFVIPMAGGEIRAMVDGYGDTRASIQIDVQPNGHYRMVTDTNPRVVQYTIITTAPGMGDRTTFEDFHLYCANHHFGYVSPEAPPIVDVMLQEVGRPNVFEGQVIRDPDGGVRIAGNDMVIADAYIEGISGSTTRTWEIWIERPD